LGVNFLDNLKNTEEDLENELTLPDVNISSLSVEQKFAFNLVMKTLIEFENNSTDLTIFTLLSPNFALSMSAFTKFGHESFNKNS
jgi:hypothetical protein